MDERQIVDTLTLPRQQSVDGPADLMHARWLKLADIALANAREEQAKIKERIRPHVENYKRITGRADRRAA
ncbi:MAG: hypothetical protein JOZ80_11485 [Acidobacteriaceae bacterium]|nr:hypothetical protein [Acidobacteriaceae bacterium]